MSVKDNLIRGTLVLTAAGLIARLLGFFNRIFLARVLSETELGRYQLVFPVFMLCMAISSSGIQVTLSKMTAEYLEKREKNQLHSLVTIACLMTIFISISLSLILWKGAPWIARFWLHEQHCVYYLKMLSLSIPFAALHGSINGFFYGIRKVEIPAVSQIIEQCVRVLVIWVYIQLIVAENQLNATAAILGLISGELAACFYSLVSCKYLLQNFPTRRSYVSVKPIIKKMFHYSQIITINRVFVTLLQNIEMILLPAMLARYVADTEKGLALFGILTGIVMPVLMFPSTISQALSMVLLPEISAADAISNDRLVKYTFEKSVRLCLIIGMVVSISLYIGGDFIGNRIFHQPVAGDLIRQFSIVCVLQYIQPLIASTLNGMGKANDLLMMYVLCSGVRLIGIVVFLPDYGLLAYLVGMMVAHIVGIIYAKEKIYRKWKQIGLD